MLRVILLALTILPLFVQGQPIPVEVKQEADGSWHLYRGGEPFYVKGAGGTEYIDMMVEAGANTLRTWSIADAKKILDEAHEKGLAVLVGMWMGQERQGFFGPAVMGATSAIVDWEACLGFSRTQSATLRSARLMIERDVSM